MNNSIHATEMANESSSFLDNRKEFLVFASRKATAQNDSTGGHPKPEFSSEDDTGDKSVLKPEDIATSSISPHKAEDSAPKSGKGVLKSVAGGITLVGAVLFLVHLRRSKGRSFISLVPSLSENSVRSNDSRAKDMNKGKVAAVYPGDWLKI